MKQTSKGQLFKRIVNPKILLLPSFTLHHVIINTFEFFVLPWTTISIIVELFIFPSTVPLTTTTIYRQISIISSPHAVINKTEYKNGKINNNKKI